jgi:hypothetical protein
VVDPLPLALGLIVLGALLTSNGPVSKKMRIWDSRTGAKVVPGQDPGTMADDLNE